MVDFLVELATAGAQIVSVVEPDAAAVAVVVAADDVAAVAAVAGRVRMRQRSGCDHARVLPCAPHHHPRSGPRLMDILQSFNQQRKSKGNGLEFSVTCGRLQFDLSRHKSVALNYNSQSINRM